MAGMEEVTRLPEDFDGTVRLFPLPELVVFPHAMQPLHIFEPRYCEMLREALASDRLIAMATLTGGIEDLLSTQPAISASVCIGRIISHAETEEGHHNILLVGAKRATVIREIPMIRPFRMATVEVLPEIHPVSDPQARQRLRVALLDAFAAVIPASANVQQNLHELMAGQMGLGPITDIIAYTISFDSGTKLRLLEEGNVDRRAGLLIDLLNQRAAAGSTGSGWSAAQPKPPRNEFPPRFSLN